MRLKRATEPRELSAIVYREILPGLEISVSFAALSPFVLGYALYRLLVGRGAAFVPQDAFFLVGVVTSTRKNASCGTNAAPLPTSSR